MTTYEIELAMLPDELQSILQGYKVLVEGNNDGASVALFLKDRLPSMINYSEQLPEEIRVILEDNATGFRCLLDRRKKTITLSTWETDLRKEQDEAWRKRSAEHILRMEEQEARGSQS